MIKIHAETFLRNKYGMNYDTFKTLVGDIDALTKMMEEYGKEEWYSGYKAGQSEPNCPRCDKLKK